MQIIGAIAANAWPDDQVCANAANSYECHDYGHPIYYAPIYGSASDRVYTITSCLGSQQYGQACDVAGMSIHIPANAQQSGGTDHELAVIDTTSGMEYDLSGLNLVQDSSGNWNAEALPANGGNIVVWWGGYAPLNGVNATNPYTASPNAPGMTYSTGITASHLAMSAGVTTFNDIQAGAINHILFLVLPCSSGHLVYPAAGTDNICSAVTSSAWNYSTAQALVNTPPDYGIRIKLTMTPAQINALNISAYSKMLLTAWATYGAFFGDTGSAGWGLASSEPTVQYTSQGMTSPWIGWAQGQGATWNGWSWNLPVDLGSIDLSQNLVVVDPCYSVPKGQTVTDASGHSWTSCQ